MRGGRSPPATALLARFVDRLVVPLAGGFAASLLALVVTLNVLEIVSRTFFAASYGWIFELNLLLAAWIYFLGIVPVYARGGDITVVGLRNLLKPPARAAFDTLVLAVSAATYALVGWKALALIRLQLPTPTPGMGVSSALYTVPLALGCGGLVLVMLRQLAVGSGRP